MEARFRRFTAKFLKKPDTEKTRGKSEKVEPCINPGHLNIKTPQSRQLDLPTEKRKLRLSKSEEPHTRKDKPSPSHSKSCETIKTIPWKDISLHKIVGKGSFSKVYKADLTQYNVTRTVAVKMPSQGPEKKRLSHFRQEVYIASNVGNFKHLVEVYGITEDPHSIVMQYCGGGSLHKTLQDRASFTGKDIIRWGEEVMFALDFLHGGSPPIIHADIKSPNVIFDKERCVKVADFGLSRHEGSKDLEISGFIGTVVYSSPEILRPLAVFSTRSDIFALGILIYEMTLALYENRYYEPYSFEEDPNENSVMRVFSGLVSRNLRPNIPGYFPRPLKSLITECWCEEPSKRPSIKNAMQAWTQIDLEDNPLSVP